jgi:uncharacterized membrane protein YobD (UPF0266 family)
MKMLESTIHGGTMKNSKDSFIIKRNRKLLVTSAIIGLIMGLIGTCFLYSNVITPNGFCKWVGIITIGTALIVILRSAIYFNVPIIVADSSGIWFDIAVFGNRIFIPWNGIRNIEKEFFGILALKWKSRTPCLVFEINSDYLEKIPTLLKSVYYKSGNRMYFASGILSVSVDDALSRLCSVQKGRT